MDNFVLLSEVFSLSLPRQIVIIKSNNQNMMKNLFLTFALLGSSAMLSAQATIKIPKVYQPVKKSMYHKGWIDFNKNGVMDVYENPNAKIEDRIEDLLEQMNILKPVFVNRSVKIKTNPFIQIGRSANPDIHLHKLDLRNRVLILLTPSFRFRFILEIETSRVGKKFPFPEGI